MSGRPTSRLSRSLAYVTITSPSWGVGGPEILPTKVSKYYKGKAPGDNQRLSFLLRNEGYRLCSRSGLYMEQLCLWAVATAV